MTKTLLNPFTPGFPPVSAVDAGALKWSGHIRGRNRRGRHLNGRNVQRLAGLRELIEQ